jgi:hypothetical protein
MRRYRKSNIFRQFDVKVTVFLADVQTQTLISKQTAINFSHTSNREANFIWPEAG